jgi:hypothetical protein
MIEGVAAIDCLRAETEIHEGCKHRYHVFRFIINSAGRTRRLARARAPILASAVLHKRIDCRDAAQPIRSMISRVTAFSPQVPRSQRFGE